MSVVFVGGVTTNTEARFHPTRSSAIRRRVERRRARVRSAKPAAGRWRRDGVDKVLQRACLMHAGGCLMFWRVTHVLWASRASKKIMKLCVDCSHVNRTAAGCGGGSAVRARADSDCRAPPEPSAQNHR